MQLPDAATHRTYAHGAADTLHAGFRVWDVVEELVASTGAPGANVFAVDLEAVARLPAGERAFMSAALVSFLREARPRDGDGDLAALTAMHFDAIGCVQPRVL